MRTNRQEPTPGRGLRVITEVYIVALTLSIYPYTREAAIDIKRLITVWAVLLLALGCLLLAARKRLILRSPGILGGIVAVFVGYTLFAAIHSPHRIYAMTQWTTFALYAVLYLIVTQCYRSVSDLRRLMIVICAAMTLSSVYGFCQFAGYDPFPWKGRTTDEYLQLPATFGNPNYAGHMLILALTMVLGLAWNRGSRRYLLLGIPLGLHFILTGMRSGRIALATAALVVILAWLAFRWTKNHTAAVPLAIAGAALTGIIGVALLIVVYHARTGHYFPLDPSLLLRYNSYYGASRMILAHPLTGVGPGAYVIDNPPYWTRYEQLWFATESKINDHVHNDLLEMAVDGGLPAAGLYLAFLLGAICQCLSIALTTSESERRPIAYALAAFFTAYLIDGLFGFNVHVPVTGPLLFIVAGALEGLSFKPNLPAPSAHQRAMASVVATATALAIVGTVLGTVEFASKSNLYYGRVYADHKDHKRALPYLIAAHDWAPWNWEPLCTMGQSAHSNNQFEDAIVWLNQCLAVNPNYLPALDSLARTYADRATRDAMQVGAAQTASGSNPEADLREAAANGDRVLELCPELAGTLECRGRVSSLQAVLMMRAGKSGPEVAERWKQARAQLDTAVKLGVRNRSRVQRLLAQAAIALGDTEAARIAFTRSIEATPDDETLRAFLTFSNTTNRFPDFLAAVNAAIARNRAQQPTDHSVTARLYLALADGLAVGGNRAAEGDALLNALAQTPGRYDLWARYARFQNFQLPALRQAHDTVLRRGEASEKIPAPIDAILRASSPSPHDLLNAVTLAGEACLAAAKNTRPEMLKQNFVWIADALRAQITAHPGNDPEKGKALRVLAPLYAALGENDVADYVLTSAESLLTGIDGVYCAVEHADLLLRLEHIDAAVAAAERARRLAPDHPLALFCLARAYAAAGRADEARGIYASLRGMPRLESALRAQIEKEAAKLR